MAPDLPPSLWPVVHAGASGSPWPPADDAAADRLVAQAQREGVLPLLFESEGLPSPVEDALARHRAWQRLADRQAEILLDAIQTLCGLLEDETFALLKGADYARRLYPRPALRPMQDVDVLVPRSRFEAVCGRLIEAGLRPLPPRKVAARAASFYYDRAFALGACSLEVHHSFVQRARHRVDYEGVWRRTLAVPGLSARRLQDVDALVYHALAMGKDEFTTPLVRYVDLWLMMRAGVDLPAAAERALEWRAARAFYGMLNQAFRLIPEMRTPERAAVAEGLLARPVRVFLDVFVLPDPRDQGRANVVTRARQLWRKFWIMDNAWRRLSFAAQYALASLSGRFDRRA